MTNYENTCAQAPLSQAENPQQRQDGVTTLHDLQVYSKGHVIKLPDFAEGQPFVARVKRPSLMAMCKSGKIPNSLLNSASVLFSTGSTDSKDENSLTKAFEVMEKVCEASLVEPSYEDIKMTGLQLTDEQMMAIFQYAQTGVDALKSFREE